jgi:hypothetical protein
MSLKSKGRFGDTETRKVGGLLSHVSKAEADIIDKYGKEGQALVQQFVSGSINPKTGMPEYFLKKFLRNPLGKTFGKSGMGKFWDTHIGRKGIIGEGLEFLGLGDNGTSADRKGSVKRRINEMKTESTDLFNRQLGNIDADATSNIYAQNSMTQSRMNKVPQGNLATNNSRMNFIDNIISGNIRNQNKVINDSIGKKLDKEQTYNLEQAKYDAEKDALDA